MQLFNTLQQQPSAQQLNTEPRTHTNSPIICNDTARLLLQRCRRRVAAMGCCGSKSSSAYTAHESEEAPLKPKMGADHAWDQVSPQDGAGAGAGAVATKKELALLSPQEGVMIECGGSLDISWLPCAAWESLTVVVQKGLDPVQREAAKIHEKGSTGSVRWAVPAAGSRLIGDDWYVVMTASSDPGGRVVPPAFSIGRR
jgi:hypothetical protein